MPLSKEFRAEFTHIIKTWIAKGNLDWKKYGQYELKVMCRTTSNGGAVKYCILCDTTKNINVTGVWLPDDIKQNIVYFICKDCAKEFKDMPEDQRESIIEKIIEKRIDAMPVVRL
jgi:hypothetical protein